MVFCWRLIWGLRQRVRERQEVSKGSDSAPKESLLSSVFFFFFSGCTMWDLSSPEIESVPSSEFPSNVLCDQGG